MLFHYPQPWTSDVQHFIHYVPSKPEELQMGVVTLGLDYYSTGLCNHLFKQSSQRNMNYRALTGQAMGLGKCLISRRNQLSDAAILHETYRINCIVLFPLYVSLFSSMCCFVLVTFPRP